MGSVTLKTNFVFAGLLAVCSAMGVAGYMTVRHMGDAGLTLGQTLAPLSKASMEIRTDATRAHLYFEELMSGDDSVKIDDLRALLTHSEAVADSILTGGNAETGPFKGAESAVVKDGVAKLKVELAAFRRAMDERFAARAGAKAGSDADQRFDATFESLIAATEQTEAGLNTEVRQTIGGLEATTNRAGILLAVIGLVTLAGALAGAIYIHATVGRRLSRLAAATRRLTAGDLTAEMPDARGSDEIGGLTSIMAEFRQSLIVRSELSRRLAAETMAREQESKRAIRELAMSLSAETAPYFEDLQGAARAMNETVSAMRGVVEVSVERSGSANRNATATREAVSAVHAAAEVLGRSTLDITSTVGRAEEIIDAAAARARDTDERIAALADMAREIGEVVTMIQAIASQTNLLALNATIEAARAGEAGRGFAVVASEVKALATQTGHATETIARQVERIQAGTDDAVTRIREISAQMKDIDDLATRIAEAVGHQRASTTGIAETVDRAQAGTRAVAVDMDRINEAATDASRGVDGVRQAAVAVERGSTALRRTVNEFLVKFSN